MAMSVIAGSTSIQKKQKQLQELQKERSAKGKLYIQEHNKQDANDQETVHSESKTFLALAEGATSLGGMLELELRQNHHESKHQNTSNIQIQTTHVDGNERLSLSQHNSKVEMELQLKQQKLLEAKKNIEGNKSPSGGRSPIGGKSPPRARHP